MESARFGVVAARVHDPYSHPSAIDAAARALNVQMLGIRVSCTAHAQIHALEADGFRLMDSLIYFERSLSDAVKPIRASDDVVIRRANPQDASAVAAVAQVAFSGYIGHYHTDPRLDPAAADAAYVEWAETSIARPPESGWAIAALVEDQVAGFLTLRRNDPEEVEIVLNAVKPDLQRRGIYQRLLAQAVVEGQEVGGARIIVSTQVSNFVVQRAWTRQGFLPYHCLHTFHKWFDE